MFCPNCGSPLPDHAKFCSNCGSPVPAGMMPADGTAPANGTIPADGTIPANSPRETDPVPPVHSAENTLLRTLKILVPALAACAVVLVAALLITNRGKRPETGAVSAGTQNNPDTPAPDTADGALPQDSIPSAGSTAADAAVPDGAEPAAVPAALPRPSFFRLLYESEGTDTPAVSPYTVNSDFSNISNAADVHLPDEAERFLSENGFFVVADAGGEEFYSVYEQNRYMQNPSFVTTDSMMHIYHLYFSHLLKNTERNYLRASLETLSVKMTEKSARQLEVLRGTEWESSAKINTAFFAVGSLLLGQSPVVPEDVYSLAEKEYSLITAAEGIADSPVMNSFGPEPAVMEDYTQYIVRGYYEGDPVLEGYFRAMMWYGRMNFTQNSEVLDRSALLMTLAFDEETLPSWEAIYSVTAFFAGASDDCGYYEYRPVIDTAYGPDVTAEALAGNDAGWQTYHMLTAQMEPPKINSLVNGDDGQDHTETGKGYRFMGQRFSVDAAVFQNLVYSRIGSNAAGENRILPSALDVPAALGSDKALSILEAEGETGYEGYSENMEELRAGLTDAGDAVWTASLYSQWLNTIRPLLDTKGEGYPLFMQSEAWSRKNLQTFLGSYAELKHDTVLYSKQIMVEMGGDQFGEKDDRGYVEPEPEVFGRLAALMRATAEGLDAYGLLAPEDAENLDRLAELSSSLSEIARKELQNEPITEEDYELIRNYGGNLEHFWQEVYKEEGNGQPLSGRDFPAAIVTDVATDPNGSVLEIGTGKTGRIYVAVPVEGTIRIATGTVFSFYEFEYPISERLTDSAWRQMMGIELTDSGSYNRASVELPSWTADFQKTWQAMN